MHGSGILIISCAGRASSPFSGIPETNLQYLVKGDKEMGAMKENPRYNVVSIRVSDEELEALQEVCKETNKSLSTVVREAMSLIRAKAEGLAYDGMLLRM